MFVEVRGNDEAAFDRALAIFKSKMKKSGILEDLRRHEFFLKPSLRRRLKRTDAHKRRRREENARVKSKGHSSRGSSEDS